ncbi:MAG TPA: ABC transporter permease [Candidatus Sulfotelmatobacter sp.]|nr:ABC transporter permease [Candidatus Sulfotelmatobacter sp.]
MTLTRFVQKNTFRNLRRSILTVLSVGFSLLLLTLMMAIWRNFYMSKGTEESALRLVTRHKVSLTFEMPAFYREKIRAIPGVAIVVPQNWFGGKYKDDKSNDFFAQFGTDPDEFFKVYKDWKIPEDQLKAWQKDRAGAVVDNKKAEQFGWKVGDKIIIQGDVFPVNLELTIRGIFTAPRPTQSLYYNQKYVEEAVPYLKGQSGFFTILADSPEAVQKIGPAVDAMFRNSPQPTRTETEAAFQLGFLAMLGNVKAFILSICGAVVFAILLVSANTMAMSIRERTREVAVLKTLGFTRGTVLGLFVGEAVLLALVGGIAGSLLAFLLGKGAAQAGGFAGALQVNVPTMLVAWIVAALVGFISAIIPSYNASRLGIVEGLRHIG